LLHPYQKLQPFLRQRRDRDLRLVLWEEILLREHRHQILAWHLQNLDALHHPLVLHPGDRFHLQIWFPVLVNQVLEFQDVPYLALD
jgi:hypothetical protein